MHPRGGEEGYALVAAVASILLFASIAVGVIAATRHSIDAATAEIGRAKVRAAAEGGVALALHSLLAGPSGSGFPLDGRVRRVRFDDTDLAISIEDERGKIPLNALDQDQARRLFAALGLNEAQADIATDSLLDWIDDDDDPNPNGAESSFYAPLGIRPRNGRLLSVRETALIRGFTPALAHRLEGVATVHFGRGTFQPQHASAISIAVMEEEDSAVDQVNRERTLAGQETALSLDGARNLAGNPFTIRVVASRPDGSRTDLRQIVIPTGDKARPFVFAERY